MNTEQKTKKILFDTPYYYNDGFDHEPNDTTNYDYEYDDLEWIAIKERIFGSDAK